MKQLFFILALVFSVSASAFEVTSSLRRGVLRPGGRGGVTLTVRDGDLDRKRLRLPEVRGLRWLEGQVASSSSTSIVNGKYSHSVGYTFYFALDTDVKGEITIPGFEVWSEKGERAEVDSLSLRILASALPKDAKRPVARMSALFKPGRPFFYAGEKIELIFDLTVPNGQWQPVDYPAISVTGEAVFADYGKTNPQNPRFARPEQTGDGEIVFRTALTPLRSGTIALKAVQRLRYGEMSEQQDDDDAFFGGFFSARRVEWRDAKEEYVWEGKPLEIRPVPPMPDEIKKRHPVLLDLMSDCRLTLELRGPQNVKCGEPLDLVLRLEGAVNRVTVPEPLLPGFKIYPAETRSVPGGIEVLRPVIPAVAGKVTPEVCYAVFNPETGRYIVTSPLPEITVTGTPAAAPASIAAQPAAPQLPEKRETPLVPRGLKPDAGRQIYPASPAKAFLIVSCGLLAAMLIALCRLLPGNPDKKIYRRLLARLKANRLTRDEARRELVPAAAKRLGLPEGSGAREIAGRVKDADAQTILNELEQEAFSGGGKADFTRDEARRLWRALKTLLLLFSLLVFIPASGAAANISGARHNPEALYNLGTAALLEGRPAVAKGYLVSALLLSPRDSDIRHNLMVANRKTGSQGEITTGFSGWLKRLLCLVRPDEYYAAAALVLALLLVYTALAYRRCFRLKIALIAAAMGAVLTLIGVWERMTVYSGNRYLTMERTALRSRPAVTQSEILLEIPAGEEVTRIGGDGDLTQVRWHNADGWAETEKLWRINDGD